MMHSLRFFLIGFIMLVHVLPTRAQEIPAGFGPLRSLIGFCWTAEIEAEEKDLSTSFNTHCFEPMLGGEFIRDRHSFSNALGAPVDGESIYKLALEGEVTITNLSAVGGIKTALAKVVDDMTLIYHDGDGSRQKNRSRLVLSSPDSYVLITEELKRSEWHELKRIEFFRAKLP